MKSFKFMLLLVMITAFQSSQQPSVAQVAEDVPSYLGRGGVTSMVWRSDGEMLAVGGYLGVWVYSNDLQESTWLPTTEVTALAWTSNNQIRVVNRQEAVVQLWNMGTLEAEVQLDAPNHQLSYSVAWNPTGDKLASFTNRGVAIWDATDGQLLQVIEDLPGASWRNLVWSPDGQMIAATQSGRVMAWHIESGARMLDYAGVVGFLAWRPDSAILAGIAPNQAAFWEIGNNEPIATVDFPALADIAWNPNGQQIALMSCEDVIAIACNGITMAIWDFDRGEIDTTTSYNGSDITHVVWVFYLTIYDWVDGRVQIWDTDNLQPVNAILDHIGEGITITSLDWSLGDVSLASIDSTGMVRVWQGDNLCTAFAPHREAVYFGDIGGAGVGIVDWHPQVNERLLTSWRFQETGLATIWDIEDCIPTLVQSFPADKAWWSPDGQMVAILISTDGQTQTIQVRDISSGELIAVTELPYLLNDLSWNSEGNLIAGGGMNGEVVIWDINTQVITQLREETEEDYPGASDFVSVDWGVDGTLLISSGFFSGAMFWDIAGDQAASAPLTDLTSLYDVAWQPQGNLVAIAAHVPPSDMWLFDFNEEVLTGLQDDYRPDTIRSIAWSVDGTQLAGGGSDGIVRIWTISGN